MLRYYKDAQRKLGPTITGYQKNDLEAPTTAAITTQHLMT